MLSGSEEGAKDGELIEGLGIIPGKVLKFPAAETVEKGLKVPQIGWNRLTDVTGELMREGDFVYFVHSFYCLPDDDKDSAGETTSLLHSSTPRRAVKQDFRCSSDSQGEQDHDHTSRSRPLRRQVRKT